MKVIKVSCLSVFPLFLTFTIGTAKNSVFGFAAEDNEANVFHPSGIVGPNSKFTAAKIRKATRQEHDDVEVMLSPGPMIAPDIILKRFVHSRVSLTNMFDMTTIMRNDTSINVNTTDNEEIMSSNVPEFDISFDEGLSVLGQSEENIIGDSSNNCFQKLSGTMGSFPMRFDEDCIIHITNPEKSSRLILACSPIPLANCSSHKDLLAINLMGDLSFKQNSFLYCGHDAKIRAISIENQLAIRIKKTAEMPGSTLCTFHSRKYRDYNLDSSYAQCGRLGRTGKIVGGRSVPPGLFPWAVQLDITRTDGSQTGCTGTIISPQYILTAAHCMKRAESVSAFMGGTDRHDIIGSEVLIQAEKYILHRKWSSKTLVADIALVKLTQPIQYSEDISPICLPEGRLLSEDMSGRRGVAIGWGRTESKKKAPRRLFRIKLPLLSDTTCRKIYRRFYIPNVMMCTDSKKDAAICYGDSGGPLMYKRQDKVYQIGVASFSLSKVCGASPDVFTKVGEFVTWVDKRLHGIPQEANE